MYPADLEEGGDSGIVAAQSSMDSSPSPATSGGTTAARMKKRGTIASQNHLQLPGAGLADNSLARDNSSLCHMAAEVPESATTKCCFWCLPLDTKIAVFIAASVGLGVNLVGVLFYTIQGQFGYALPSLFSCLLYSSALLAQYRQRASLFLPFLLINAIFMFLWACLCVYLLTLLILLPDWCVQLVTEYFEWDEMDQIFGGSPTGVDRIRRKVRLFLAVSLLLTLIYLFMECWLWWLVYRGFKAAKDWHAEEWLQNLNKNIRSISIY